jgi:hypothetical protein
MIQFNAAYVKKYTTTACDLLSDFIAYSPHLTTRFSNQGTVGLWGI